VKGVELVALLLGELSDLTLEISNDVVHVTLLELSSDVVHGGIFSVLVLPIQSDDRFFDQEKISFLEITNCDDSFAFAGDIDDLESGR